MSRKPIWHYKEKRYSRIPATLVKTCPIPLKDDWRHFMEEVRIEKARHDGQPESDDLYDLYCQYAEASRIAVLSVTLSHSSRRNLAAENPCMSREEFQQSLNSMSESVRQSFIRRLNIGYAAARAESFPGLKAKFEQMMLPIKGA